jgi:hypothetical protein
VAQPALKAAAIENQRLTFVLGQLVGHLGKLAVRNADGSGDVAFVVFFALGSGVDQNDIGIFIELLFNPFYRNRRIVAGDLLVFRETIGKYFNIGVTEFFRLPGGFVAQLSGGAAAVKNKQGIFTGGQLRDHLIEFAVGNADSPGDVAFVIFGTFGPGIDDYDVFGHGNADVLHHKININDIMELPVGLGCRLCSILSRFCGGTSRCKGQNQADGQE